MRVDRVDGRADVANGIGEGAFACGTLGGWIGDTGCEDRLCTARHDAI